MKERIKKIKRWIKENKGKTVLITVLVISLILSITYAMFYVSGSGTLKQITMGTLKVEYIDGETINAENALPLTEDEVDEYASKTSFTIKNSGNITGYAEISLIINNLPSALNSEDFRWTLYKEGEGISTGSFKGVGSKLILKKNEVIYPNDVGTNYSIAIWIRDNGGNQNSMLNQTLNAKIDIKASDKAGEYAEYGINPPELVGGLIPVVYDDTKDVWVKANIRKEWYSYNKQKWANAVTVTNTNRSTYMSAEAGTEISMDDINTMWVWIPRYKYKIPSNMGSSSALTNPPQIDVVFETGLKTTGVDEVTYRNGIADDGTNTNYYTHPAFRNGAQVYNATPYDIGGFDKELTGFWVGKFNVTGHDDGKPKIIPYGTAIRYENLSSEFKMALNFAGGTMDESTGKVTFNGNDTFGLSSSVDTHMMKNTEWGAVAILSQSQYGKMGNSDYTGTDKEIYVNNSKSYFVGRSGGGPGGSTPINATYPDQTSTEQYNSYGFYTYNDYLLDYGTNTQGSKVAGKGTGASTTGTIYGIYDMSGGAYEYVMGNWEKTSSESGFTTFPESKYYDLYQGTSSGSITKEQAILGDATWETIHWYSDYAGFVNANYPWFQRGGAYNSVPSTGIFYCAQYDGSKNLRSFRSILIP